jgi:hypothetical protein
VTTVRAKFQCTAETQTVYVSEAKTYKFNAVYDLDIPEDQRYSKYTPSATLEMTVDNPNAGFALGKFYYLDFVPVDDE